MNTDRKVTNWDLERFVLNELPKERARGIAEALESDPEGDERVRALQISNQEILDHYPPRIIAAQIEARLAEERATLRSVRRRWILTPALATLATTLALISYLSLDELPEQGAQQPETIILKGDQDPALTIYRKGASKEERLRPFDTVTRGDVLQLRYAARGARYGVIFSVDGSGQVTLHFPSSVDGSTELERKGIHTLPYAYELDDAPFFERFFFVTGDKPLDVKQILQAGTDLGGDQKRALQLPADFKQTDFLLKKNTPEKTR